MKVAVLRDMTPCNMEEMYRNLQERPTSISYAEEREHIFFDAENTYHTDSAKFQKAVSLM
jgi:hypothetical protein